MGKGKYFYSKGEGNDGCEPVLQYGQAAGGTGGDLGLRRL